jgi:hypothetical protein
MSTDTSKAYSRKDVLAAHRLEHIGDRSSANVDG